jgi:outer membrane protein OmpA-like peptidoglycan-associated protein
VRYGHYLWLGLSENGLIRFDLNTNAFDRVDLSYPPGDVVTHAGAVWVSNRQAEDEGAAGAITRVDATTLEAREVASSEGPSHPFGWGGSIWVANNYEQTITQLDAGSGEQVAELEVGSGPTLIADAGQGQLLVLEAAEGSVSFFDPGPLVDPPTLVVTVGESDVTVTGPGGNQQDRDAVVGAITSAAGAAPTDQSDPAATGVSAAVRVVGDGTIAEGALAQRLDAVSSALEAGGLFVDRDFLLVPPPSAVSIGSMLNALLADSSVFFDSGSAELKPESLEVLSRAADLLGRIPFVSVTIEGHTDSDGDEASNQALSEQRAQAVLDYFSGYFGDSSRFIAIGYGESQPIADNSTDEGKARNRRIQLVVVAG